MDLHESKGTGVALWMPEVPFEIPLRCLLQESVQGLVVAGRAMSATRDANGGSRHMGTAMCLGEAAGIYAAKDNPGKLNYASAGAGTMPHLGAELFKQVTATQMTHVPYKGSGAALPAVMGGQVDVYFDIMFSAATLVQGGKLKALGVTSLTRSETFPGVPTLDEQGVKGYELYSTFGIAAHAGTPDPVVAQLNEAINKVLQMPAVRERLSALGASPAGGSAQMFQKIIRDDYETWGRVIRQAGIDRN